MKDLGLHTCYLSTLHVERGDRRMESSKSAQPGYTERCLENDDVIMKAAVCCSLINPRRQHFHRLPCWWCFWSCAMQ